MMANLLTQINRTIAIWMLMFVMIHLLASQSHGMEVYKWIDEKGTIHFSDFPPDKAHQKIYLEEVPPGVELKEAKMPQEKEEKGMGSSEEEINPLTNNPLISGVDNNGHDRKWWQEKKKWWINREKELIMMINVERRNLNVLRGRARVRQTEIDPNTGRRIVYPDIMARRLRGARRQTIRDLEKELEHARFMLSTGLKEEARKAGAPLGWLK